MVAPKHAPERQGAIVETQSFMEGNKPFAEDVEADRQMNHELKSVVKDIATNDDDHGGEAREYDPNEKNFQPRFSQRSMKERQIQSQQKLAEHDPTDGSVVFVGLV